MFTLIISLSLSVLPPSHIQWGMNNRVQAQATVLATDVVVGCVKAAIGSDDVVHACLKGMLGGAVLFSGQYLSTYAYDGHALPMPAVGKLIQDLGVSMQDNLFRGQGMFDNYQTDIGFASITVGKNSSLSLSFLTLGSLGMAIARKDKLDWRLSLNYLTPVFQANESRTSYTGYTLGNILFYLPKNKTNFTLSHELVHIGQFSQYRFANDVVKLNMPKNTPRFVSELLNCWSLGQDGMALLMALPSQLSSNMYWNNPVEIEAYFMERKQF